MIDGCLEWQEKGLAIPQSMHDAAAEYLEAEDTLGQWIADRCEVLPAIPFTSFAALYRDWCEWCERWGHPPGTGRAFSQRLVERGFRRARDPERRNRGFAGIGLRP